MLVSTSYGRRWPTSACGRGRSRAQLEASKQRVQDIGDDITELYADPDEDASLIQQHRKELQAAEEEVRDHAHRAKATGLRVDRAQQHLDAFLAKRAQNLLAEREPAAREVAMTLTRCVNETVRAHQDYAAMRQEVDRLVAHVPNAVPRLDGVTATYAWERELKDLTRAVSETPEVEVPLPRWAGLQQRQLQDNATRFEKLRRKKRPTADEQAELDRLSQDRVISPPRGHRLRGTASPLIWPLHTLSFAPLWGASYWRAGIASMARLATFARACRPRFFCRVGGRLRAPRRGSMAYAIHTPSPRPRPPRNEIGFEEFFEDRGG
jgi:hypothetical protein